MWFLVVFLFVRCLEPPTPLIFPSEKSIKRGLLTPPQIQKLWYDMQIKIASEFENRPLIIKDLIVWEKDA